MNGIELITAFLLAAWIILFHVAFYLIGHEKGYKDAVKDYFAELLGDCPPPNPQKEVKE